MNVFQSENEIKRLNCQEEILQKAQDDILDKYLSKRKDLNILDIGSNDGFKTKLRFDKDNVAPSTEDVQHKQIENSSVTPIKEKKERRVDPVVSSKPVVNTSAR